MSSWESSPPRPSPRRELQGPRPAPLKVRKESYKIKKPPMAPPGPGQPSMAQPAQLPPLQHRPPVIIYTVSPKVIHTKPGDFMSLVQRLTGADSTFDPSEPTLPSPGALSPAARLAAIEKSVHPSSDGDRRVDMMSDQIEMDMGDGATTLLDRPPSSFPGILSPMPSSLPLISPSFFSPAIDPNSLSFLHELSPAFHGNRSFLENTFFNSPNNFLTTPTVPSPGAYSWDLFNNSQDF